MAGLTAMVTGAGSGIGHAITTSLLERGASVVGVDLDPNGLASIDAENFLARQGDVTVEDDLRSSAEAAVQTFGSLDMAFNVAGVSKGRPLIDLDEELWDFNVDRVLKGVFFSVKHEARIMQGTGGAIVNVSSINARVPMHSGGAYSSAKAGVEMLTRTAALELARFGIRVNSVQPGLTDTPLTRRRLAEPGLMADWLPRIPLRRHGRPDEIASACLFLASSESSYVTGASLVVDGGWDLTGYPDLSNYT